MDEENGVDEELPTEQEAITAGLALVAAPWDGDSDFDRGMRLLQKHLGVSVVIRLRVLEVFQ